ncbi:MAG: tetratricopeptide repeat protein [Proteobacteria bacterium]|nr:tetratricopeptide repeat protein [Pseudomonadota bacterium]
MVLVRLCIAATIALALAWGVASAQMNPDSLGASPAVKAFEEGRFAEALAGFSELQRRYPDDPLLLRYLGLTYLRLDRPADAVAVLERAQGDPAAGYALGVAWARLGHTTQARAAFRRVIEAAPASADAERARAYLDNLADAEEAPPAPEAGLALATRPWALTLRAGLQYDDNVPPVPPGDPRPRRSPRAILAAEGYRDLWEDGGWRLRAEGIGTASRNVNASLRRFDLVDLETALDAGYSSEIAGVTARPGLRYALQPTFEGGRLANVGHLLTSSLSVSPADGWVTSLAHWAEFSPFVNQSIDVGSRATGGVLQSLKLLQFYLPAAGGYQLYGGYTHEWNDAAEPNAAYRGPRLTFGGTLGLPRGFRFDARLEAFRHDYPRFTPEPKRRSEGWLIEAFLSRAFAEGTTLSIGYQRAMEESNIRQARYGRNLITMLLSRAF